MLKKIPPLHSLTWLWCSLLAYSALFGLLQKVLSLIPGLPEGVGLLLISAVATAVPLTWSALTASEAPPFPVSKATPALLLFLMSLSLSGSLAVMVLTPFLERVLNLAGITALPAGDATATPMLVLYICVVAPVLEELVYRGVVLRRLLPGGGRQAIVLSALCFALMHHDLYQGMTAFWGGLVFGYAALHHGLRTSIGLHIAGNSIAMALPLLRHAGTAGALGTLAAVVVPVAVTAAGAIRLLLKRRGQRPRIKRPHRNGGVWRSPALWMLLAFDTVYLLMASFSHR